MIAERFEFVICRRCGVVGHQASTGGAAGDNCRAAMAALKDRGITWDDAIARSEVLKAAVVAVGVKALPEPPAPAPVPPDPKLSAPAVALDRLQLEEHVRVIGGLLRDSVKDLAGDKVGFCLMLFDFGEAGSLAYMSNAERADMIKALDEFRGKLRAGLQ